MYLDPLPETQQLVVIYLSMGKPDLELPPSLLPIGKRENQTQLLVLVH